MIVPIENEWLDPLLAVGWADPEPRVRVAALDAAACFPLGPEGWRRVAEAAWDVVATAPAGAPEKLAALELAARIPLRSLRGRLRTMVRDPAEPDRDAIAAALDRAADPERIRPLLEQAHDDRAAGFRWLAAMAVEDAGLSPADVPPLGQDALADAPFWRALVLARLGWFDALDAIFAGDEPEPELFWGSPWAAYDAIAAVRPVPARLRQHLLEVLDEVDALQATGAPDPPSARLVRLTVWAATGIADAEGSAVADEPPGFGPVALPDAFRVDAPIPELVETQLHDAQPRFNDGQLAWILAREPAQVLIHDIGALLVPQRPVNERLRLARLIGMAADCQAGRGGSPFRGAGPGAGGVGRVELIDDSPHQAMAPPPATGDSGVAGTDAAAAARPLPGPGESRGFGFITPDDEGTDLFAEVDADRQGLGRADGAGFEGTIERNRPAAPGGGSGQDDDAQQQHGQQQQSSPEEERAVQAQIFHDGRQRCSFVAGADNLIRCWIGLPEPERAAVAELPIQRVDIPPEGLQLSVELCWGDQSDRKLMVLPADRSARSNDCDLRLHVPEGERFVSAEIMFRYRGRAFEVVQVEAAVLAPGEAETARDKPRLRVQLSRRQVIELPDSLPCDATLVFGTGQATAAGAADAQGDSSLRVFGGTGGRSYMLRRADKAIDVLNDILFATEKSLVRRRALRPEPGAEQVLDVDDEDVRVLLRDMARYGAGLYNQLERQGFKDPGERIQLLNLDPDTYLPLEFVYDRGYPADAARLCPGWLAALEPQARACPACGTLPLSADERRRAGTICPLGFWSLQKVIERLDPADAANVSAPRPGRRSLPAIDSVLFASSHRVPADEREATWAALQRAVAKPLLAHHWDEWFDAVKHYPPLLVALPHHDVEAVEDFLEIGDEALGTDLVRLRRGQIRREYVNPDGRDPGPILLLLGCRTGAQSELGYVHLVREFQQLKTSIVLGTLAQILGRHAAPLAREVVEQLVSVDDPRADFGTVMRRVRRRMLARGYLMALCLVALGDAEWHLTPLPRPAPGAA